MNLIISVVVPIYNVERYLNRCIDSLLEQTLKEFEILLIDDGSTDSSGTICDDYASKYKNIRVIHKENTGVSDTRNVGIANAKGDYIFFLDSDDYIIPDCLEILYTNMMECKADLSCGSFGFFDDRNPVDNSVITDSKLLKCSGEKACMLLLYGKDFYTSSCNILIKKEIAKKNLFPIGKYHEDELTTFRYFLDSSIIIKTNINTYFYYQREGSIMHSIGQPIIDEALAGDNYVDVCKNINKKFLKAALCKKYFLYISVIENYPEIKQDNPEFYKKLINYIKDNSCSILFDCKAPLSIKKLALKHIIK